MYSITNITPEKATEFFFSDPALVYLGLGDEEMYKLAKTRQYAFQDGCEYLGVYENDTLQCIIKYNWFTTHCINFHMYMRTNLHHSESLKNMARTIKAYFIENVPVTKVMLVVPSTCTHVHKFVAKFGFKQEGLLTNSYQWRQEMVDLHIYGLTLRDTIGNN